MEAILGLGSNIEPKASYLNNALSQIGKRFEVNVTSPIYETKPWGKTDQENFLNQCIAIESSIEPIELLRTLKQIETVLGRKRREHWGPREIDLDILLIDDLIFESEELMIPHPEMINRDFVLKPLLDIRPNLTHPIENKTIQEICSQKNFTELTLYQEKHVELGQ